MAFHSFRMVLSYQSILACTYTIFPFRRSDFLPKFTHVFVVVYQDAGMLLLVVCVGKARFPAIPAPQFIP
jgi:hypothetical protein